MPASVSQGPVWRRALRTVWLKMPAPLQRLIVLVRQPWSTVTGAALLVDDAGRVLLLAHVFRANAWGLPGGFVRKGEQVEDAVRREVREEVGLEVERLEPLCVRTSSKFMQIEIIFRGRAAGEPTPDRFEISEARWFAPDALPPGLDAGLRGLIAQDAARRPPA